MSASLIDFDSLQKTTPVDYPYPHQVITDFLKPEAVNSVLNGFPKIDKVGRFLAQKFSLTAPLKQLLSELESADFRQQLETLFEINLANRPTVATLRGCSSAKDGRAHLAEKGKILSVVLYLNEQWRADAGRLRVLNQAQNMEDYTDEVIPKAGTAFIYKATANCWRGYQKYVGRRQVLSFDYFVNDDAVEKFLAPKCPFTRF